MSSSLLSYFRRFCKCKNNYLFCFNSVNVKLVVFKRAVVNAEVKLPVSQKARNLFTTVAVTKLRVSGSQKNRTPLLNE
jgi:hypothetical protein